MEVQYLPTRREYQHAVWRISTARKGTMAAFYAAPILGCLFILSFLLLRGAPVEIGVPVFLISALLMAGIIPLSRYLVRMQAGHMYDVQSKAPSWCEYVLRLEPDHVFFQSAMVKTELKWEAVTRITEDEHGFFLYISPINAHFIPRRVFVNAAEAQQFWTLAQEYHAYARKAPSAV